MKVEIINSDIISVFINNFYFKDVDLTKKIEFVSIIKDLITKIDTRYKLNLNGFYKIKVYPHKKIGVFLDIIKIDDNEFSNGADFRIVVYQNEKFFLQTECYEQINSDIKKRYYNHNFYIDINDIDDIYQLTDIGTIIYGDSVKEMLCYGVLIK
ncbi:MAG: hypothetical protein HFJ12_02880 [Bacilli bacterium]|nr:hypothetical protein [Bacilli bacterium]